MGKFAQFEKSGETRSSLFHRAGRIAPNDQSRIAFAIENKFAPEFLELELADRCDHGCRRNLHCIFIGSSFRAATTRARSSIEPCSFTDGESRAGCSVIRPSQRQSVFSRQANFHAATY